MNLRKYIFIILPLLIAAITFAPAADLSAKRKSKAKTSQTTSKKSKKNSKSSSKKSSRSKKSRKKSRNTSFTRRVSYRPVPPAPEVVMTDSLTLMVSANVVQRIPSALNPGGLRINSIRPDSVFKITKVGLNENFTYLPVTNEIIDSLASYVRASMPDSLANYKVILNVGNKPLSYYITKVDRLPEKFRKNPDFVTAVHPSGIIDRGLKNDIIALWHSHGRYFKPSAGGWLWQRPLLFETVEDIYPMAYILPYLTPMLENAGAYVFLPRERDINRHEVIVDNDVNPTGQLYSQPYYRELTGDSPWETGKEDGFIYDLPDFRDTENPFENGTYRQTMTISKGKPSLAAWYADIPETGEYAVYISYKSLPNSTEDARYTVNYSGGCKEFKVNQTMGGSTWIYLGTFPFEKGYSDLDPIVTLSNLSDSGSGLVVTADAIKIGGGMGNIARSEKRSDIFFDPSTPENEQSEADEEDEEDETDSIPAGEQPDIIENNSGEATQQEITTTKTPENQTATEAKSGEAKADAPTTPEPMKRKAPVFSTSGLPRFLEGARYWLHWAGAPEEVYSPYHGSDDYKDDYTGRAQWVNWLAGGSRVLPKEEGLGIPVDMTFALHTDAGKRADDSTVGILGIYYTQHGDSYADGTPRINSRMLTDIIMRQICNDIRREHEPNWTRRSMWDKSYVEARVPEVPTTLIELLSHQNFADMYYGLDPNFRFTVSRAIYKGMGRFLAERKGREFIVQPLPVHDFAIRNMKKGVFRLSWQATPDSLEETAKPDKYLIYERIEGELGFHKIGETTNTHFDLKVNDQKIHSFKIAAFNAGGESFPSEVLALRNGDNNSTPVLIINGFNRVSAPAHFSEGGRAGFDTRNDFGVPYIRDISFAGYQNEFNRSAGEAFGRSGSDFVSQVVAGNTFDFPAVHGEGFAAADMGFVSSSVGAVEAGEYNLSDFKILDLILGKQKSSTIGKGVKGPRYETFSPKLQQELHKYSDKGGDLIVSGEYAVSDLFNNRYADKGSEFAQTVLGASLNSSASKVTSGAITAAEGWKIPYSATLNEKNYIVENPDVILPAAGSTAEELFSFPNGEGMAGIINSRGRSRVATLTIPLEAIPSKADRIKTMKHIITKLKND